MSYPGEDWYEKMSEWDASYTGEVMQLTKENLLDHLEWDAEQFTNANYHSESTALWELRDLIEKLPAETPLGWFAWSLSDLGSIRQCIVVRDV
jgi:hypothetical protein